MFSRIKNIIGAKVEKAVSGAEAQDPVGIIRVQIQKAKEQLLEFEQVTQKLGGNKISLEKRSQKLKEEVERWAKNAETTLNDGNEGLAKQALERQAGFESELEGVKTSLKKLEVNYENMKKKVIDRKNLIKQKDRELSSLQARQEAAKLNKKMMGTVAKFEGNGDAFDQIDLMTKKVEDLENEVEAAEDIQAEEDGTDLEKQFQTLETNSAVDDKLAALKKKMGKKK